MYLKKPKFWNKKNILSYLLLPFTIITKINNFIKSNNLKKKSKKIKTICVGNIYVGGTGKTPTTIKLYQLCKKTMNVATAKKFYTKHKDEEILLKNKTNFITAKNRSKIIEQAIKKKYEVLIFDDGLQDSLIDYDIKIVCFDGNSGIGNGFLIPAGPLRENLNNLIKYDIALIKSNGNNSNSLVKLIKKYNSKINIFTSKFIIKKINKINKSRKFLIFSGIGNPKNFEQILLNNKIKIIKNIVFPDHYKYTNSDLNYILNKAKRINAKILTTEKDYVKIPTKFKKYIEFLTVELVINDEEKLFKLLKKKINDKN